MKESIKKPWETRNILLRSSAILRNYPIHRMIRQCPSPARVEAGVTTRWHRLKGITERYFIISGKGLVEIGEQSPQEVTAGDIVLIPPMCRQRITNTGSDDLIFLAICSPRFTQDTYEDIEDQ